MCARPNVAVWLDSYRQDLRSALDAARRDGFRAIEANSVASALDPGELSHSARRHFTRHLNNLGLSIEGLAAEFPGAGLTDPATAEQRLRHLRAVLEACRDLAAPHAVVNLGGLEDERRLPLARQLIDAVADLSDRTGVPVALRPAAASLLPAAGIVDALGTSPLTLALDAPSVPTAPDERRRLVSGASLLHVRDARRLGDNAEEVPIGAGDVDLRGLFRALAEREFRGGLIVRCDAAGRAVDALRRGREYVESHWPDGPDR